MLSVASATRDAMIAPFKAPQSPPTDLAETFLWKSETLGKSDHAAHGRPVQDKSLLRLYVVCIPARLGHNFKPKHHFVF